jgi:hypothetical protein
MNITYSASVQREIDADVGLETNLIIHFKDGSKATAAFASGARNHLMLQIDKTRTDEKLLEAIYREYYNDSVSLDRHTWFQAMSGPATFFIWWCRILYAIENRRRTKRLSKIRTSQLNVLDDYFCYVISGSTSMSCEFGDRLAVDVAIAKKGGIVYIPHAITSIEVT